jgi:hypothetical protein
MFFFVFDLSLEGTVDLAELLFAFYKSGTAQRPIFNLPPRGNMYVTLGG